MAKRTFQIRANFPLQGIDLVETVSATSWPAALGAAARKFKKGIKGRRIKAASFTLQQVEQVESVTPEPQAEQATLANVAPAAEAATPANEIAIAEEAHNNS